MLVIVLTAGGCAAPFGGAFANYREKKAIERAAADDSIPQAAEVGLASANTRSSSNR